jgi:hypothetical protein
MAEYPFLATCVRRGCGHDSNVHSIDEAQNLGPCDPGVKFRCQRCRCPDMIRSERNLADLDAWAEIGV